MVPGTEKDVNYLLRNVLETKSDEVKSLPSSSVGIKDMNTGLYDLR